MATKVYGASDDLIEFEGDVRGEVGCYADEDKEDRGCIMFDDGTVLDARYGKAGMGIWELRVINKGPLFDRIESCTDEDADPHSDVVYMKDGAKRAFFAKSYEKVH